VQGVVLLRFGAHESHGPHLIVVLGTSDYRFEFV
jgi:hypothetical protein